MAYQYAEGNIAIGGKSFEDLSANQNRFVVRDATAGKYRRPDSATEHPAGVLITDGVDAANLGVDIVISGIVKVVAGETLVTNDIVCAEYVSATDAGKAVKIGSNIRYARGIVHEGCDEDYLATIELLRYGVHAANAISAPMGAATASATTTYPILAVNRAITITSISFMSALVPVSASGTLLLNIYAHVDVTSAENLLQSAANIDLETIIADAHETYNVTLTATTANLTLAAGDSVYATITSNNTIGTNVNGTFYVEYEIL